MFLKSRQKANTTTTTSSSVSPQSTATSPSYEQRRITDPSEQGVQEFSDKPTHRFEQIHDDVESLQSLIDEVASRVESRSHSHEAASRGESRSHSHEAASRVESRSHSHEAASRGESRSHSHEVPSFPLKGILRDSSPTSRAAALWDVDPSLMTAEEKTALKNQELEDERKRSVRFADFEKLPLDIRFEMPDSEDSLTPSSDGKEEWESDDDKQLAADLADASSLNNNDLKKELFKLDNLNSRTNVLDDLNKLETNWLEVKNKRERENKDESDLLNRLSQLKQKEIEIFNDNSTVNEKIVNKNLKCLDNNNFTPNIKLDLWDKNSIEELDLDLKDGNLVTSDNMEKTPDSGIRSASYETLSEVVDAGKTKNANTNDSLHLKNNRSINDLLDDIKSFSDLPSQPEVVSNRNNNETRQKTGENFVKDIPNRNNNVGKNNETRPKEGEHFVKDSLSPKSPSNSFKRHYFIDEDMMDRVDLTEEQMYSRGRSPRSLDNLGSGAIDKKLGNSVLIRPRDFGGDETSARDDSLENDRLSFMTENKREKSREILVLDENQREKSEERLKLDEEDEGKIGGNGLEYSEAGISRISVINRLKNSNESESERSRLLGDSGNDSRLELKGKASSPRIDSEFESYQENMRRKMQTKLNQLQKELDDKLDAARKEFSEREKAEFERLERAMNEKLDFLRQELKDQEEKRRTAMREITDSSLEEYKRQLDVEKDEKLKKLEEEKKNFLEKQEEISKTELKRVEDETNHRVQASVHILAKVVEEVKQREEKEIERIKSESDERMELIRKEYEAKQEEFTEKMKRETEVIEQEMTQMKVRSQQKWDEEERTRRELREAERRRQQEEGVNTADEHRAHMQVLREQCKQEEETLRKKHADKVEILNRALEKDSVDITQLTRDFEKVRCEKRLLEDKYRTLKEKYIKLKSDIRLSLERKRQAKLNRKNREQSTTEDTDRSTSHSRTEPQLRSISPRKKYQSTDEEGPGERENVTPKTIRRRPTSMGGRTPVVASLTVSDDRRDVSVSPVSPAATLNGKGGGSELVVGEGSSKNPKNLEVVGEWGSKNPRTGEVGIEGGSKNPKNVCDPSPVSLMVARGEGNMDTEVSDTEMSSSFASLPQKTEQKAEASNRRSVKSTWTKEKKTDETRGNPLENLKQQLEKLDELEEQFPASAHTDTYLRYPFSGPAGTSCELEFYRHRLHLERESVKRAKQALIDQKRILDGRQAQLKRASHTSSAVHQLQKEEVELTDMEVHLHRTKALLGEKIIRLKRLEQSLEQCAPSVTRTSPSNTLSEASHSSGFSGSDLDSSPYVKATTLRPERYWTDASFNVLQSLENINCEIREIWGILGKQQIPELGPPPLVQYSDLQQHRADLHHPDPYHMRLQTAEIADRTRGLRDWLVKARHDPTNH
ncbi:GRIP and coiled-coil domain-containing protein 2-like [Nilaparvata lugens]|uniref:GRIP and coiled-coil domain-containing protein 2-like n=1 Tax=Nilaparvata lugens TaxID=108931 RepID=UPI00193DD836|nr:GRIP and coiled-coil domain-containing protein 2-like [Nilaparvata lugens]